MPRAAKPLLTGGDFRTRLNALLPTKRGREQHFVLAVSGGADSLAMLVLAGKLHSKNLTFSVVTIDHALRPEAKGEAQMVRRVAKKYGLAHKTLTVQWGKREKPSGDIQAAAREKRYALLLDWCAKKKADGLVLAHHQDDQAETFLLRLIRGSGVDGLSAMQAVRVQNGVAIIRPFLDVPQNRLAAVVDKAGLKPICDPSNYDGRFERVKIRTFMPALEKMGLDAAKLADTAARLQASRATLAAVTQQAAEHLAAHDGLGIVSLNRHSFADLPAEIGQRLLRRFLTHAPDAMGGDSYPPRQQAIGRLYAAIMAADKTSGHTLGGFSVRVRHSEVLIHREAAACAGAERLAAGQSLIWDGRFLVTLAKTAAQAVRVQALGADGLAQLKAEGGVVPSYAPAGALHSLASVWKGRKVLAVAGLKAQKGVKIDICPQKHEIDT